MKNVKPAICLLLFIAPVCCLKAQHTDSTAISFSLREAIRYAKESNKLVEVWKMEEKAAREDRSPMTLAAVSVLQPTREHL